MVVANHLLITGPSRGGKSEWAEQRIRELAASAGITYLATGPTLPDDAAWQRRLNRHRQRRPEHWRLLEASSLSAVSQLLMQGSDCHDDLVLLDSLGGLVASGLELNEECWLELQATFVMALANRPTPVVWWLRRWAGVLFRQPPSEAVFETAMAVSPGCVSSTAQKAGW